MSLIDALKEAAKHSGTPIDDIAVKLLEQIYTPEVEAHLKAQAIAWLKSKVNDPGSQLDDIAVGVIANLLGVAVP